MFLIFLRSLVFNVLFYAALVFCMLIALPSFLMPRAVVLRVAGWLAKSTIFLMRVVCDIKVEFRGVEKIPKGPLIVASKHQSMWETLALLRFFEAPFFVVKRELNFIPLFGWYLIKTGMVAIDRSSGRRALNGSLGWKRACAGGAATVRATWRRYRPASASTTLRRSTLSK